MRKLTSQQLIEVIKDVIGELSGIDYEDLTKAEKNILIKCERTLGIN
jgi:hypothetical protein